VVSPDGWVRRWVLCTTICPISGSGLPPVYCQPICLSRLCYCKFAWSLAPCPSPFLRCTQCTIPPLLCILFSSLFIIQIFFFLQGEVSLSRELCWFIPWGTVGYWVLLICSPVGLCLPSRFGAGIWWLRALLFSQCNEAGRSFVQAEGLGCWSFAS
jgi:hypothetical protein